MTVDSRYMYMYQQILMTVDSRHMYMYQQILMTVHVRTVDKHNIWSLINKIKNKDIDLKINKYSI